MIIIGIIKVNSGLNFNLNIEEIGREAGCMIAKIIAAVGGFTANVGSQACMLFWLDEPESPKSLIK